ncbi:Transcriptional regulator, MerR family [hydrothermal vent metagenome]|uniref:Transcriptional regulator, MerR family n=1 Tax=hydrothermal vent metagenome TaxID=652676 RepID=A0A3B0ZAT6_9ZZZZ
MPIGRFSKSCRLTIKALRHYDDIGLLKPAYIDPNNGYRYYAREQARSAVIIAMLRSLDVSIPAITQLLCSKDQHFQSTLKKEQQRIKIELAKKQQTLQTIERIAKAGNVFPYNIAIRTEPAYMVARHSGMTTVDTILQDSVNLIDQLYSELQQAGRPDYEDPVMCINEDPDKFERITVHACIGIKPPYPNLENANIIDIPSMKVAWLNHHGAYEELGLAYHALFAWAQEHGYEQSSAMREIYLNDPSETAVDDLRTEVLLPIGNN